MNKIYVITKEDKNIGYFSNREKTEKYCFLNNCDFYELKCMDNIEVPDVQINCLYEYVLEKDKKFGLKEAYWGFMYNPKSKDYIEANDREIHVYVNLDYKDDAFARVQVPNFLGKYLTYCFCESLNCFDDKSADKFNNFYEME